MAKKNRKKQNKPVTRSKATAKTATKKPQKQKFSWEDVEFPKWFPLATGAVLTLIYYAFSTQSTGWYQHDEVGHFLNMQDFWVQPSKIMGIWAKPGYKIMYVIPAYFGKDFLIFFNCLVAGFMALITYWIAKEFKLKNAWLVMVFVGLQPMLYQISFRNYSEIMVTLFIALVLLFYLRKKYILAAIFASYLIALRQELGLVVVAIGLIYLYRKLWIPFLFLGTVPLLLNIAGWAMSGDPLWLLTQLTGGVPGKYNQMGFWHFWKMFTPTVGTIVMLCAIIGIVGATFLKREQMMEHFKKYLLLYLIFFLYFIPICMFTSKWFTWLELTANLRQLVVLAPVTGLFALIGFNWFGSQEKRTRRIAWIITGGFAILVMAYMSYGYDHFKYLDGAEIFQYDNNGNAVKQVGAVPLVQDYSKILVLIVFAIGIMAVYFRSIGTRVLVILTAILVAGQTLYIEEPYKIFPQDELFVETADWVENSGYADRTIAVSHILFNYYLGTSAKDRKTRVQRIDTAFVESMPVGGIVVWDAHYGFKRSNNTGMKIEYFTGRPNEYKVLFNKVSRNEPGMPQNQVVIFEKQDILNQPAPPPAPIPDTTMVEPDPETP